VGPDQTARKPPRGATSSRRTGPKWSRHNHGPLCGNRTGTMVRVPAAVRLRDKRSGTRRRVIEFRFPWRVSVPAWLTCRRAGRMAYARPAARGSRSRPWPGCSMSFRPITGVIRCFGGTRRRWHPWPGTTHARAWRGRGRVTGRPVPSSASPCRRTPSTGARRVQDGGVQAGRHRQGGRAGRAGDPRRGLRTSAVGGPAPLIPGSATAAGEQPRAAVAAPRPGSAAGQARG